MFRSVRNGNDSSSEQQCPGRGGGGPADDLRIPARFAVTGRCRLHRVEIMRRLFRRVVRIPGSDFPNRHASKNTVLGGLAAGWRERGPLCRLRWAFVGRPACRWAENKLGSGWPPSPLGVHPRTPSAWGQRQGGGGADLCVRSAGCLSGDNRPDGQKQAWIGLAPHPFNGRS